MAGAFEPLAHGIQSSIQGLTNEVHFSAIVNSVPLFDGNPQFCEQWLKSLDRVHTVQKNDVYIIRTALLNRPRNQLIGV